MNQGSTVQGAVQALLRRNRQQLAALEAIAGGRFTEAQALILDLLADTEPPIVAGQCRYCSCTEERACAIAVHDDAGTLVVRCSWWDDDRTVCSKLSCIARYEREQGRVLGEHTRIVRP